MSNCAVLGIGSNLGDRLGALNAAIRALNLLPATRVTQGSRIYETEPLGVAEQPRFLNACLALETGLSPHTLLGACLGIEACAGRVRREENGPRVLDLDILLYETVHSDSFELTLPHPRILERAFVMAPLLDLFPTGRAPGLFFGPHLREIGMQGVALTAHELVLK